MFDYDEFAKELYERDKSCKDIRSALAALFIDSQSCSYRAGREFETDTQYHGWRHNTRKIGFETEMNGITVQVPLSSYFDAHFKNKYSYDKDDYALLYPFFNDGRKVTSALSQFSCEPKEDYYRFALDYAGGSFDDNSWVKDCTDVSRSVVGNILADYYYDKGCEVAQDVATPIKSFRLSEKYTDSSLLFDNFDHGTMGAPHFSGYEISFDDRDYDFDRQAAKDMREFCDYESKESETTVSRKMLHVPEVAEYDKDLEY